MGGLVPRPNGAVLDGLPLTLADLRDFRTYGPHIRLDVLSAPTGGFVARVSAFVNTGDTRLGHVPFVAATDATFTPVFTFPSRVVPLALFSPAPMPPLQAPMARPPTERISTRTRRRTAAAAGATQRAADRGSGSLDRLLLGSTLRCAFRALDHI